MTQPDRTVRDAIGYRDDHAFAPSRWSHTAEFVGLAAVVVGDVVAFQQLAAVAMSDAVELLVWALVVALSAAATLSMHLAGTTHRARRAHEDHPGYVWYSLLIGFWLALGGGALWFRLQAEAAEQGAVGDGLGATVDTGAATNLPMAVLLLLLYLVGGLTAYGIGYRMHNPARSAYFRARTEHRRALRGYRRALRLSYRASRPRRHLGLPAPETGRADDDPALATVPSLDDHRANVVEEDSSDARLTDELAARRASLHGQARSQARQLRTVARHRVATALAEPARSSALLAAPLHDLPTLAPRSDA